MNADTNKIAKENMNLLWLRARDWKDCFWSEMDWSM